MTGLRFKWNAFLLFSKSVQYCQEQRHCREFEIRTASYFPNRLLRTNTHTHTTKFIVGQRSCKRCNYRNVMDQLFFGLSSVSGAAMRFKTPPDFYPCTTTTYTPTYK
eukprot:3599048-Amphidinium_carterae.1